MSQPDTTIEDILNEVAYRGFVAGQQKDSKNADNLMEQSEIAIKRATQSIQAQLDIAVKEANKDILDALYWMYVQYCGKGHDFMGAGEDASELLEKAGYIKVDSAGRITEDFKELKSTNKELEK